MSVFGPSPKVPAKWPSMLSIASSDGGGSQGCLSPSVGRPGALNIFRAAEAGDLSVILSYLSGGGNANKAGKVSLRCRDLDAQSPSCWLSSFRPVLNSTLSDYLSIRPWTFVCTLCCHFVVGRAACSFVGVFLSHRGDALLFSWKLAAS